MVPSSWNGTSRRPPRTLAFAGAPFDLDTRSGARMPKTFPRGRICWTELTTTDPKAAQPFYKATVGWGTQPWDMDPSYVMWTARGTPVGGLLGVSDGDRRMGAR